jgi:hypothetical protein
VSRGSADSGAAGVRPVLAGELVLAPDVARPGEKLPYAIVNTGTVALMCGHPYLLERWDEESWVAVNPDMAFTLQGYGVVPGGRKELTAEIPTDAVAGLYRISTRVFGRHAPPALRLSGTFEVIAPSSKQ